MFFMTVSDILKSTKAVKQNSKEKLENRVPGLEAGQVPMIALVEG